VKGCLNSPCVTVDELTGTPSLCLWHSTIPLLPDTQLHERQPGLSVITNDHAKAKPAAMGVKHHAASTAIDRRGQSCVRGAQFSHGCSLQLH
jgi:hypothetical protein